MTQKKFAVGRVSRHLFRIGKILLPNIQSGGIGHFALSGILFQQKQLYQIEIQFSKVQFSITQSEFRRTLRIISFVGGTGLAKAISGKQS